MFSHGLGTGFNSDLSSWDVSSGITFDSMFQSALMFNQNISGWDVDAAQSWRFFKLCSMLTDANTPAKFL